MAGVNEAEDLYQILGVATDASLEKIRDQFRFLAQAFHPDKQLSPAHKARAEEMLRKITEAYRVLSDPAQRLVYDKRRATRVSVYEEVGALQREQAQVAQHHLQREHHDVHPESAHKIADRLQDDYVCSECGGRVAAQARFCRHCGKTFVAAAATAQPAPAPSQPRKIYSRLRGVWTCSNCRGVVRQQSTFCIHCGQSFDRTSS